MNKKPSVLIVGLGIVGQNLKEQFEWADYYDKYDSKKSNYNQNKIYDFAFICVPTPHSKTCDLSEVKDAVKTTKAKTVIIKSTVPPGTSEKLNKTYNKDIVFSPEFYGTTQHALDTNHGFVILGGPKETTIKVANLYQCIFTNKDEISQTNYKTAEMVKYMDNCFLAMKVVFANEFYRVSKKLDINYHELRELFLLDPRIGKSHLFVYPEEPYYDSKCFNKDVATFIDLAENLGYENGLIDFVQKLNKDFMVKGDI